jgi:hypothetical protein
MNGRLDSVLAELALLGAVDVKPGLPPEPPPTSPEEALRQDTDVETPSEVDETIALLTAGFKPDDPEPEPEEEEEPETEPEPTIETAPPVRPRPQRADPTSKEARVHRRLQEALARIEILEAALGDLRDSFQNIANEIKEG